jgi:hypothetical protein
MVIAPAALPLLGDAVEIARARDLLVVHLRDHVAALEAEVLRQRACATSSTTTPSAEASSRISSASAGEMFAIFTPMKGERA